jgi:hypothetical protein
MQRDRLMNGRRENSYGGMGSPMGMANDSIIMPMASSKRSKSTKKGGITKV